MRVLLIGGTRFMGHHLAWRLIAAGHDVTLLNRGTHADPFRDRVTRLRADRRTPEFAAALAGRSFDAAVDFAAYTDADGEGVVAALDGRVGHYVMISTGQVYLVRAERVASAREEDYDAPLMAAPPAGHRDRGEWEYGMGKRACEDALARAWAERRFPSTRIRIPIVNGERDDSRRLEGYVWRILDRGPVLLPDGGNDRVRQVYSGAVVATVAGLLGRPETFGKAYNLCQEETPTIAELVTLLAQLMGASARVLAVPSAEMEEGGVDPRAASPFSTPWKSALDPGLARRELGFRHPPLATYMDKVLASLLAHMPAEPPPRYAQRPREIELAGTRKRHPSHA